MTYVVGQQVVVARRGHRKQDGVQFTVGTVTRAGTIWIHVQTPPSWTRPARFAKDCGLEDTDFRQARLFPSLDAAKEHIEREELWNALAVMRFWGSPPEALSTTELRRIVRALQGEPAS